MDSGQRSIGIAMISLTTLPKTVLLQVHERLQVCQDSKCFRGSSVTANESLCGCNNVCV